MKALFIGAGSIGKRHIRDFYLECKCHGVIPEIDVLRRDIGSLGDVTQYVFRQITEIIDNDYDVVFVTNPTNLHYDALMKCRGRTKWYFVEKPIFERCDYDISCLDINEHNTYVAAPMRHRLLYKKMMTLIDEKKVFSIRAICSSYLPSWRKGIDYRDNYSAKKEMGGGVNLDLIHEIDYIYNLFGQPEEVLGVSGKFSDLEINSNDLSAFVLKYCDKLCEIHLDYFGRKYVRNCEIYTNEGTYIADFFAEKLIMPDGTIIDCHVKENEGFLNEMHYFYEFIMGKKKSINPPQMALAALKIAMVGD